MNRLIYTSYINPNKIKEIMKKYPRFQTSLKSIGQAEIKGYLPVADLEQGPRELGPTPFCRKNVSLKPIIVPQ